MFATKTQKLTKRSQASKSKVRSKQEITEQADELRKAAEGLVAKMQVDTGIGSGLKTHRDLIAYHKKRLSDLEGSFESWGVKAKANTAEIDMIEAHLNLLEEVGADGFAGKPPDEVLEKEKDWSEALAEQLTEPADGKAGDRMISWLLSQSGSDGTQPAHVLRALHSWITGPLAASASSAESILAVTPGNLETVRTSFNSSSRPWKLAFLRLVSRDSFKIDVNAGAGAAARKGFELFNEARAVRNLKRIGDVFALHPKLHRFLKDQGVTFEWLSDPTGGQFRNLGGGFGGASLVGNKIHLERDTVFGAHLDEFAFHEIGHATLQRWLIKDKNWKPEGHTAPEADTLTDDGHEFYKAWVALKNNKKYFFVNNGAGIGGGDAEKRQDYLAGGFNEFCAESCMQMILMPDALQQHVNNLKVSAAPKDVQDAYEKAMNVLVKFKTEYL
jgi:hypothetical protein